MRCLMCGKDTLSDRSLYRLFFLDDQLCMDCRSQWHRQRIEFRMDQIPVYSSYVYNEAFASCLLQYKECGDEALKDVFLCLDIDYIRIKFHGYTILLMPSSEEKMQKRGFSHLSLMCECLHMPILNPFAKKDGSEQKSLHVRDRQRMIHDIILKDDVPLPRKILLFDDVITTGSTLKGALSNMDASRHSVRIYTAAAHEKWLQKPMRRHFSRHQ